MTEFYCCKEFVKQKDSWDFQYYIEDCHFKYCPYCGRKLSTV